jgi:hypothetical protein
LGTLRPRERAQAFEGAELSEPTDKSPRRNAEDCTK